MSPAEPVRVVVADDQTVVREGLRALLAYQPGVEVVAVAASAEEALDAVGRHRPQVLLTDLGMPGMGGIEGIRQLGSRWPDTRAVALTALDDAETVRAAVGAGALGFLNKFAEPETILAAVRAAAEGRSLLDGHALAALLDGPTSGAAPAPTDLGGLTPREVDVLRLVATGRSNQQVSRQLYVSVATVKTHMNHLLAKTGCGSRAELVRWAFDHGLG